MADLTKAAQDVLAERERHVSVEGWQHEHDDLHDGGALADAAACYAATEPAFCALPFQGVGTQQYRWLWPWDAAWWKPTSRRRNLVKAGALILAEIERLDRQEKPHG